MIRTAECLVDCKDVLGESPVWHAAESSLYWIDVARTLLHRLELPSGRHDQWNVGKPIGSFVLRASGGLLVAFRNTLAFMDEPGAPPRPFSPAGLALGESRFNDGKCDRQGRFWVGTMDRNVKNPIGNLYRLDADLSLHSIDQGFIISNGPCFSPDGNSLYFNDSRQQVTWRYTIDPVSGAASPRSRLVDWGGFTGRPDGATVDAEGGLWVAEVHGRRIVRFTPDGQVDRAIEVPCERPTSVCFGGPDMQTMFITTSTLTLKEQDLQREPLTGGLFAVDAGVRGLAETAFGG